MGGWNWVYGTGLEIDGWTWVGGSGWVGGKGGGGWEWVVDLAGIEFTLSGNVRDRILSI